MSIVEHIEAQIRGLVPRDLAKLRDWFIEYDAQAWDRQIAADSSTGKLDALKAEAFADYAAGRVREL